MLRRKRDVSNGARILKGQSCLRLPELDLAINDNPDGTAERKQVPFFTTERCLGDQTPPLAAGLPGCHHASLARTRPPFDANG